MYSTRFLAPAVLLMNLAACMDSELYPTSSVRNAYHKVPFSKDRVSQTSGPEKLVKLTFQFLPRVITTFFTELDIRMTFNFMSITNYQTLKNGLINLDVGLSSLHLTRLKDGKLEDIKGEYERNHKALMFFKNFQEFQVRASFKPSIPVGYVDINKTCWDDKMSYSACIESLWVEEDMGKMFSLRNPFSEEFWELMRGYLHHQLRAELECLHMTFPLHHNNVLFRWFMWMLGEDHVDIYDFRMSSSELDPDWGPLNTTLLQVMPFLTRLDLSNNGITTIQPEYLTTVSETLTFLSLGRNKLSAIPPEIYNFSKLTFLDLSRNKFKNIDSFFSAESLNSFPLLNFLNMSYNAIRHVELIEPMLTNSNPKVKPFNLKVLDLSFCELINFNRYPDLFSQQCNMTHLFLAGNKMGTSPFLHFGVEQQMETIDLTFNNLTTPLHILDSGQVSCLNISLNNITNWTNHDPDYPYKNISVFRGIDNLNLSLNTIPALTAVMGESLERLKTVDLGDNPIDCASCAIPEFQQWLRHYNSDNHSDKVTLTFFNKTPAVFRCTRPPTLKSSPVLNITFDDDACREEEQNLFVLLGVPLAAILSLLLLVGIILYAYRYEATYLLHLVKIKRRMKASAGRLEGDYKYDGFVCYSGADRAWVVGDLLPTLENGPEKYRLCLHERDFMLGTFITSNIVEAMQGSRNTIVVLTENFVKSQWCKWELEMANHKLFEESREFLVLIELERLDRSALPRHLKYLMDTRTYLEWPERDDRTGEVEVVYRRLKEALGPSIYELEQEQEPAECCNEQDSREDIDLEEMVA